MRQHELFEPKIVDVEALRAEAARNAAITLRPYQIDAVCWSIEQFMSGIKSTLVVLPTGTGKSVVFAEVMRRWAKANGKRILLLAHRRELLTQAVGHSARAGMSGELEMADNTASRAAEVVCASVQTLVSKKRCGPCRGTGQLNDAACAYCGGRGKVPRYEQFHPGDFSLIVTDEAHHATARMYRQVYQWFTQNPDVRHLGVTATPRRADDVGMHNIFDEAWDKIPLPVAIDEGWLVPLRQMFVRCESLKFSASIEKTRGGDFREEDLEKAYLGGSADEEKRLLHEVAYPVANEAKGGKTFIVFAASVAHAEKLASELDSYPHLNGRIELLLGNTNDDERRRILKRMRSGESVGLVNCGVCTEGFDLQQIEIVAIARPTKSESLYLQMIGRGTRPLPGTVDGPETAEKRRAAIAASAKPFCLVMDFVGASGALKQQTLGSVLSGLPLDDEDLLAAMDRALRDQVAADMQALITQTREERLAEAEEKARKMREARERAEEERRVKASGVYASAGEYTRDPVPMFMGKRFDAFADYKPTPTGATQKQVNLLVKMYGVDPATAMAYSKKQATAVIDAYIKKQSNGAPIKGLIRNKFAGRCAVTGQRVEREQGWVRKNDNGKWETISDSAAKAMARQNSRPQQVRSDNYDDAAF